MSVYILHCAVDLFDVGGASAPPPIVFPPAAADPSSHATDPANPNAHAPKTTLSPVPDPPHPGRLPDPRSRLVQPPDADADADAVAVADKADADDVDADAETDVPLHRLPSVPTVVAAAPTRLPRQDHHHPATTDDDDDDDDIPRYPIGTSLARVTRVRSTVVRSTDRSMDRSIDRWIPLLVGRFRY